jgi:hypothetical protein
MTAVQDWLNIPTDPRSLKALICDVVLGRTTKEPAEAADLAHPAGAVLMGRGRERC